MHPLLIEALLEDIFSDLIKKFPTQGAQLKQAKNEGVLPKYLPWLARMLAAGSAEPIEDIIPVIKAFHNKQPALKAKFPDEPSVIDINSYKSVADLSHKLESLVNIKYQSAPSDSDILFQDKKWLVAMPRTTAGSCELGKDTEWCTARTGSRNLFLNYVGRGQNIFLFYVIDKEGNPRSNPDAKLSISFVNGEPDFRGEDNGPTVNAAQTGITKKSFQKIVGADNADKFISLMQAKIKSYDGKHPAQEEMDAIARDPILLKKKLNSFVDKEEKNDFAKLILENKSISPESLRVIISLNDEKINSSIARNGNTPIEIVRELSDNENNDLKAEVAFNPNCPPEILRKLSHSNALRVLGAVASNSNCPLDVLEKFSEHENDYVQSHVAGNPNCPPELLRKLSVTGSQMVRNIVFQNPNCPLDIIDEFINNTTEEGKASMASNPNCPPELLRKLSVARSYDVQIAVVENPNCPHDVLTELSDHENPDIKAAVAQNPNCPVYILVKLSNDPGWLVTQAVASNPNCPPEILRELSEDKNHYVRLSVAGNLNTPPDILLKLGNDPNTVVKETAEDNPNYPKTITESRFKAYIAAFFNI